jgi:hypothetical protein
LSDRTTIRHGGGKAGGGLFDDAGEAGIGHGVGLGLPLGHVLAGLRGGPAELEGGASLQQPSGGLPRPRCGGLLDNAQRLYSALRFGGVHIRL